MTAALRQALWTAAVFAAIVLILVAVAALLAAGLSEPEQRVLRGILDQKAPLLGFVALVLLLACAGCVRWLSAWYVAPVRTLAEQARIVVAANPSLRIVATGSADVEDLARAIDDLAEAYRSRRLDSETLVADAKARLEEERNRLAALMSELTEGVLLCDARGRILLYNEQARALFTPPSEGPLPAHSPVGLGRSLFAFVDRDHVAHALDKIQQSLDQAQHAPQTTFLAAAPAGGLVRVRLAPSLAAEGRLAGMVLTLEDATTAFGDETKRRALLEALSTRARQSAANVRAAAENLAAFPSMTDADRARFTEIVAAESFKLSETIDAALREYADVLKAGLALEDMRVADLLGVARRHIDALPGLACRPLAFDEGIWVRVDSYALLHVFASLAERVRDGYGVRDVWFATGANRGFAEVDLAWQGPALDPQRLAEWEAEPMRIGAQRTPLTIRDVIERHGAEVWLERTADGARFRFLIPQARPMAAKPRRRVTPQSRPEYYDFDLFAHAGVGELAAQRLSDLSYTVFDTETTGVEPSAGDRIVSIGAVRIVNGRLLKQEVFDQLVDPQRPVSAESVRVHGLRMRDLEGQPLLREVLPAFYRFCEDTVLVAHNAAFDMRFLELAEAESGVRFSHPVLDTLLLSAIAHPNHTDHRLEAIAERLGVPVIGRHTALGDALVTSEVFLKLVAVLAQRGIVTLEQALDASRQTYYVRLQY